MLLINISGILYYLLKKVNSSEMAICNTTHLKKAKKGRRNPGYELGGWEPKNDLNWNNIESLYNVTNIKNSEDAAFPA